MELKELYDIYLVLIHNKTYVDSISCDNPTSWFVPLQFLAVSFVFFEHEDVIFARMSVVVVVYAVVSLSASSFACGCSGLFLRRSFWDALPGLFISVLPIFCMHHYKTLEPQ